ncbi:hypothetical protein [Amycolatopsis dendrobii]|uniref:Uncharacterized protein n=1 Tax=Amycolatopsis dendrobii TaxID=2760662 RepID=A0A7W3VVP7_9PSEU|nr:hypothetical protein [Amycolatopsis dendrobii]MBB1153980.1 hypothetical protein [Amycolatopsis dendrobii]
MKPKPRVYKGPYGWMVDRPGYGFTGSTTSGPHPSQPAALRSLTGPGYAGGQVERTDTPSGARRSQQYPFAPWPVEVL